MSETTINTFEEVNFPSTPLNSVEHEAYYSDACDRVRRGETVWVQRNFNEGTGRILDLFSDKKAIGYIDQDFEDMRCDVYVQPIDNDSAGPRLASTEPLYFDEAVDLLRQAL